MMHHDEHASAGSKQQRPSQELYVHYTVRLRKGSLASQGLVRHSQRFNCRYEAGWLATLIEEFYVLLDGPDPRESLLYPLLYHRFEEAKPSRMPSAIPQEVTQEEEHESEDDGAVDLTELQEMSKNLRGYFDGETE
jgi:hypothetical protein